VKVRELLCESVIEKHGIYQKEIQKRIVALTEFSRIPSKDLKIGPVKQAKRSMDKIIE